MRSSRLLKISNHKFTELNKNLSPTRMPEARQIPQQHQNLPGLAPGGLRFGVAPGAGGLGLSNVFLGRGYSSCSNSRVPSLYHGESVLLDRISSLKTPITIQHHRSFTKKPDLPKEAHLNQYSIKRSLRLKAIEYTETHACIKIDIPVFTLDSSLNKNFSPTDIRTPTIHINKRTGNFVVPSHGVYGTWQDLEILIGIWVNNRNKKKHQDKEEYPVMNTIASSRINLQFDKKFDGYKAIQNLSEKDFERLLNNLNLSEEDYDIHQFAALDAKVDKNLENVIFPIRYIDGTLVGYRILSGDGDHVKESNYPNLTKQSILPFPHGLYEASITSAEGCILVGSILDSLSLSRKTRIPVITLPESGNLHPDHIPFFEQFQSICIWLDNNVQGSQNAKMFAQKMGDKKCRIVSSLYPRPSLCTKSKSKIKEILSQATSNYHESLITFEHLRDDVYLEFVQNEELMGVKFDRFSCLKNTLGGFRRGELTIFSGRTGSGKTTFLSEYSLDLCAQGVNTLWCSFEVRNTRLLRIMMKQFSLINIDDHINNFEEIANQFTKLPLYLTDFHGSQNISRVVDAMSHAVYVHDITHVIIDNMQFMLGSAGSGTFDRFGVQDQAIEMFRKFATAHNCHVTLVIHPRKEDDDDLTSNSIFGGAKATQEADNVLLLQEEKLKDSFFKKKCIEVVKNRYAGNLGKMKLMFCKPINTMSRKAFDMYKGEGDYQKPPPKSGPPKPPSQSPKISMQLPKKDIIADDTPRIKDKVVLEDDEDIFITTDFLKSDH